MSRPAGLRRRASPKATKFFWLVEEPLHQFGFSNPTKSSSSESTGQPLKNPADETICLSHRDLMRPGIVASPELIGSINRSPASLVPGQVASSRGGATITLPSLPELGNLLVVVVIGSRNTPEISFPVGFAPGGEYISVSAAANTGIMVFSRRVQPGDTNRITMNSSNVIATAYEFRNAYTAVRFAGGAMDGFTSGDTFSFSMEESPFSDLDAIVGAVGGNQDFRMSLSPNASIIEDYSNTAPTGGFGGANFRVIRPYPAMITGVVVGSPSITSPVYGFFAVLSNNSPE